MKWLVNLFTAHPVNGLHHAYICDGIDLWPIDEEYEREGISEGWLVMTRYYRNANNEIVVIYVLT